jgi:transposase
MSGEIQSLSENDPTCQRLMTVPGIGPIISSAVVAAIGTGSGFKQGRDFAAWLGLVPKQDSTGDRTKLGRISKRANKYLRTLFVQAAHVVLGRRPAAAMRTLLPWIDQASKHLPHRILLAIALANKLARIELPPVHQPSRSSVLWALPRRVVQRCALTPALADRTPPEFPAQQIVITATHRNGQTNPGLYA